jgi:AcrR family transcriptional regulator
MVNMTTVTPDPARPAKAPRGPRTASADVERALLEAAERLLETEGPDALSVRRIASEAGVAPMSVYNRFEGKNGIVDELFTRGFDELSERMRSIDVRDPIEALHETGRRYGAFGREHPAMYAVMFEQAVPGYEPSEEAIVHASRCFEELATHVRRAMAAGAIVDGDAQDVAQQLWSACHGAVSLQLRGFGCVDDMVANHERLNACLVRGLAVPVD